MERALQDLLFACMGVSGYLSLHYFWVWSRRRTKRLHLLVASWCLYSFLYQTSRLAQIRAESPEALYRGDWWSFALALVGIYLFIRFLGELSEAEGRRPFESVAGAVTLVAFGVHATTEVFVTHEVATYSLAGKGISFSVVGPGYAAFMVVWAGIAYLWGVHLVRTSPWMTRGVRWVWLGGSSLYLLLGLYDVLLFSGWIEVGPSLFEYGFLAIGVGLSLHAIGRVERIQTDLEGAVSDRTMRLEHALEGARSAARAKSEFLANVSHEVRTPLNGIIGLTRLLGRTELDDAQQQLVHSIETSEHLLLSIINDVLDFSRIEARRVEPRLRSFDLCQLLAEVCETHRANAADRGIALECQIAPELPARIRSDSRRLAQVLHNLLANALKFTEEGRIWLRVAAWTVETGPGKKPTEALRFEVEDSGVGIPQGASDRLFEAFSQLDSSPTRRHAGTGLGLAIVKELVELLGGAVGVENAPEKGSIFWFWIPLVSPRTAEMSTGRVNLEAESSFLLPQGTRVLVVEDNEVNRLVAVSVLEELGAEVTAVEGGTEALEAFGKDHFDLVFMDCQMPEMDGFECTQRLRRLDEGERVPIVAFTAHAMEGDRERCLAAGMDDYVAKPLIVEDLVMVLERFFGERLADTAP